MNPLQPEIDNDINLKSKRKILVIASLLLLTLELSKAKVEEANTFILKITFEEPTNIRLLLAVAVFFLLIQYYSNAYKYHMKVYGSWSRKLLSDKFFINKLLGESESFGLITKLTDFDAYDYSDREVSFKYRRGIFERYIEFNESDDYEMESREVGIRKKLGIIALLKTMLLETKYKLKGIFQTTEMIEIYAPYIIAIISLVVYFINSPFYQLFTK